MRRRLLITAAAFAVPLSLMTRLESALAATPEPTGASAWTLDARLAAARAQFDAAAHAGLLRSLPSLLADAHQGASETRRDLDYARLSSAYTIASQLLNKLGQYKQSRLTADRATLYADGSGSRSLQPPPPANSPPCSATRARKPPPSSTSRRPSRAWKPPASPQTRRPPPSRRCCAAPPTRPPSPGTATRRSP